MIREIMQHPGQDMRAGRTAVYYGIPDADKKKDRKWTEMGCTTILAGRSATYDGSTLMARNEDAGAGSFAPKKMILVRPEDQPREYVSVISGIRIPLPENPMAYSAVPNALPDRGIWGEAGINSAHTAMTETETITSNPRVQGADPLVKSGIGEEDMLTLVLPYIHSAREGVLRLGSLLEQYGTYEMNGIGFQDVNEIWWMETIGGHHWIARRVPDDAWAVIPNQQGIDYLDLEDALSEGRENLCSADLADFIETYHLNLGMGLRDVRLEKAFDVRAAFGSREDSDHAYNTPRAWSAQRFLNPSRDPGSPVSDTLPWCLKAERKITPEDVKYVLSDHFQGTPYDPYGRHGDSSMRGQFRPIGVNRTNMMAMTQIRPGLPEEIRDIQWIAMGSNVFNAMIPLYTNVGTMPAYLAETGAKTDTRQLYWVSRLIGALADAHFPKCSSAVERYQLGVHGRANPMLLKSDAEAQKVLEEGGNVQACLEKANQAMSDMMQEMTDDTLGKVLYEASLEMKNAFARSDA